MLYIFMIFIYTKYSFYRGTSLTWSMAAIALNTASQGSLGQMLLLGLLMKHVIPLRSAPVALSTGSALTATGLCFSHTIKFELFLGLLAIDLEVDFYAYHTDI